MSRGRIRDEGGGDNGTWIAQKALLKEFFDIFAGKKVSIQKQVEVILLMQIDVAYC